jgi:hypothetical protein
MFRSRKARVHETEAVILRGMRLRGPPSAFEAHQREPRRRTVFFLCVIFRTVPFVTPNVFFTALFALPFSLRLASSPCEPL